MQIVLIIASILIFPILSFMLSWYGLYKDYKNWKRYVFMFLYGIFIFAYGRVVSPNSQYDIVRYFDQLERIQGLKLTETIRYYNDNLYFENILFWVIAQLRMPHLLPAITTCTVYGVGAYIAGDYAGKEEERNILIILLVQLIMIPFNSTVFNIRNVFAFSLAVLAAYRDLYKKKRNLFTIILYAASIFMHKTGIIIFIIRMCIPLVRKFLAAALLIVFSIPVIIGLAVRYIYLIPFRGTFGTMIQRLAFSADHYLHSEDAYAQHIRNSMGATLERYIVFIFIGGLIILYLRQIFHKKNINDFEILGYLLCLITLGCNVIDTPAYWRFAVAAEIACPPIMHKLYSGKLFGKKVSFYLRLALIAYLCIRFAFYEFRARADLAAFDTIYLTVTNNAYTILFQILRRLITM